METHKQQISRLYRNNVHVEEAVKSMRDRGISSKSVKSIYNQLSRDDEKLMTERFHYYTTKAEKKLCDYDANCWTSRYLLACAFKSADFHEIKIIDVFNNKSM
jgi:hypothetical protein